MLDDRDPPDTGLLGGPLARIRSHRFRARHRRPWWRRLFGNGVA